MLIWHILNFDPQGIGHNKTTWPSLVWWVIHYIIDLCYLFFREWFNFFFIKFLDFSLLIFGPHTSCYFFYLFQRYIYAKHNYIFLLFLLWNPWMVSSMTMGSAFYIWFSLTGFYNLYIKNTLISTYETSVHLLTKYRHTGFLKGSVI